MQRNASPAIRKAAATVAGLNADIARWRAAGMQVSPAGLPRIAAILNRLERRRDEAERALRVAERTTALRTH